MRQSGVVNQCCFCDAAVDSSDGETLTLVVSKASRVEDRDAPTQQMWCHAHCLGDRVSDAVPFEASAFDD